MGFSRGLRLSNVFSDGGGTEVGRWSGGIELRRRGANNTGEVHGVAEFVGQLNRVPAFVGQLNRVSMLVTHIRHCRLYAL